MTTMIIQFIKDEGLPVVWQPAHAITIQKKDLGASETVCQSQFCVLSRKRILLLYSLKSFLLPVLACVATHRSRQKKPSHFAN